MEAADVVGGGHCPRRPVIERPAPIKRERNNNNHNNNPNNSSNDMGKYSIKDDWWQQT